MLTRFRDALSAPVDPASFLVFRVGFGLLAAFAALRFVAYGWVDALLLEPAFLFSWVHGLPLLSKPWLYALFVVQCCAGIGIAVGWRVRLCLLSWLFSFGYVELLDKTLYLNHYVLFSLLGFILLVSPVDRVRVGSVAPLPRWVLWLFRVQVCVYMCAFSSGFLLNDRLIRAARVSVAIAPPPVPQEERVAPEQSELVEENQVEVVLKVSVNGMKSKSGNSKSKSVNGKTIHWLMSWGVPNGNSFVRRTFDDRCSWGP